MPRAASFVSLCSLPLASVAAIVALTAAMAQTPFQPRPLVEYLDAHGWVSLSIPDNKMRPGSVIKLAPNDKEVRWLGDYRSCGVTDAQLGFVRGKYPALGVGENFEVKVSAFAKMLDRIGLGAEAQKVSGAILKIDDSGGDAIDLLAFAVWMARPGNAQQLPAACTNFLSQEDVYLVSEAFRVSKGSYQLIDKTGAKISLTATAPRGAAGAEAGISIGSQGTLDVAEDFYFGVRRVKQLAPGSFATLGSDPKAVPEADDLLRKLRD